MTDSAEIESGLLARLVLIPALITLAITLLRLVGELEHASKAWFNSDQGGYLSIVGIVWLAPLFAVYFALRLGSREPPAPSGRAIALAAAGCAIFALGFYLFNAGIVKSYPGVTVMWGLAVLGAALVRPAWPALFKTLLVYGLAARIPVAVVMLLATWLDWPSHYNAAVPGNSKVETYILFGLIAQLVWWVCFTIVAGTLVGTTAAALARLRRPRTA